MKLVKIWNKLGRQPLSISQHTDAKVFIKGMPGEYYIMGVRYKNGKTIRF